MPRRKKKPRAKRHLAYASDLNLKCRCHIAVGGPQCGKPAEFYEPGIGDVCIDHKRTDQAIKYARKPAAKAKAASMRK